MTLLLLSLPYFVVSAVTGWRWTVALPVIVWPANIAGVLLGWWGNGVGDFWQLAVAILIATGIAAAALGIGAHGAIAATRARRPTSRPVAL